MSTRFLIVRASVLMVSRLKDCERPLLMAALVGGPRESEKKMEVSCVLESLIAFSVGTFSVEED